MNLDAVLSEVERWPIEERIQLIQEVWDRLADQGHEAALSDEMKAELDRRLAAYQADPTSAIPWDQVEAEALARFGR